MGQRAFSASRGSNLGSPIPEVCRVIIKAGPHKGKEGWTHPEIEASPGEVWVCLDGEAIPMPFEIEVIDVQ